MTNSTRPLCIYHSHCADGFAAAWIVNTYHRGQVDFHAAGYGSAPPDVTGRQVIIVDFSYPRDVLIEMAGVAERILVLDHHKTAKEALVDLPANVTAVFDMERSGAMLAWDRFAGGVPPRLIAHVQDRDLWRFQEPRTAEYMAAVFSHPYDFDTWTVLASTPPPALIAEGVAILRKHKKDLEELMYLARPVQIAGYTVPAINLPPFMASDAGHILSQGQPFAAIYWDTATGRKFSLRSQKDGVDVAALAQQFGGGGHAQAAGFFVSQDHALAGVLASPFGPDTDGEEVWSANGETFNFDSLEELVEDLASDDDLAVGRTVYRGRVKRPNLANFVSADSVIDEIGERSSEIHGEFADDYPEVSDVARDELQRVLEGWVAKHCRPTFWGVKDVTPYELAAADIESAEAGAHG